MTKFIIHGGGGRVLTVPLGDEEGRDHRKAHTPGTKTASSSQPKSPMLGQREKVV